MRSGRAAPMPTDTELEILDPVVARVTVPVMHRLVRRERSAKMPSHDVTMLQDVRALDAKLHVAIALANVATALPVRMLRPMLEATALRASVARAAAPTAEANFFIRCGRELCSASRADSHVCATPITGRVLDPPRSSLILVLLHADTSVARSM